MDSFTARNIVKLLPLLFFLVQFVLTQGSHQELMPIEQSTESLQPVLTEYQVVEGFSHDARRRLAPLQRCSQCKCCSAGSSSNCAMMPCCYALSCHLPKKPSGTCAFVPIKCGCKSCDA